MAYSAAVSTFASAAVAAPGTSVAPSVAVPDNCHTILITNPSTTLTLLWGIGTVGAAITQGVNGAPILPGSTLTLGLGTVGAADRGNLTTAGSVLIFDAVGGAITAYVTYVNRVGSP